MPAQRWKTGFAVLFALANAGAYVGCLPLLAILLPLKAAAIEPAQKTVLLSWIVLWGALAAGVVNIAAGALSDRTRSRFGRRRPWILAGALATAATYALVARAETAAGLLIGVLLFQAAFNLFLPALAALLPDWIPDARKGTMAAFLALGPPIGLGVGGLIAGAEALDEGARYVVLAAVFLASVAPLALIWREPAAPAVVADSAPARAAHRSRRDFALVWASRLLIQVAISISQGYALYFLHQAMQRGEDFPDRAPEALLSGALLLATAISIVTALIVGVVSDALRHRKYFVATAGAAIAAGMTVFALWPTAAGLVVCQMLYGLGVGLYSAADIALAAEILPQKRNAARDLAVLNLGNTLPQTIAPILALSFIGASADYALLYLMGASAAAAGGVLAACIRYRG